MVQDFLLRHSLWLVIAAAVIALRTMGVCGSASLPAISAAALIDLSCTTEQMVTSHTRLCTVSSPLVLLLTTVNV